MFLSIYHSQPPLTKLKDIHTNQTPLSLNAPQLNLVISIHINALTTTPCLFTYLEDKYN